MKKILEYLKTDKINISDEEYLKLKCQWANDTEGEKENSFLPDCPICKNKGVIYFIEENNIKCKKCQCEKTRITFNRLKESGITETNLQHCTFANFKATEEWQQKVLTKISEYEKVFLENKLWFVFSGGSGIGKTHLCTALLQKYIRKGYTGEYVVWNDFVPKMYSLERSTNINNQNKYDEKLERLRNVDILYIDDFLKLTTLNNNEFQLSLVYKVLNHRYMNNKITILSTEYSFKEIANLDVAIAGRIHEKTNFGQFWLKCADDPRRNYRLRIKQEEI